MFLLALLVFVLAFSLAGSELEELTQLEDEITKARNEEHVLQAECLSLEKKAVTFETATAVTIEPSNRPMLRGKESSKPLYSNPMTSPDGWFGWPVNAKVKVVVVDGKPAVCCSGPFAQTGVAESVGRSINLPPGKQIRLTMKIKGIDIKAVHSSGGSRVGLIVKNAKGTNEWIFAPPSTGTFDWIEKNLIVEIPEGYRNASFNLGLTGATGTVYLRDLCIELIH